jgi:hypothetical protein
MGKTEKLIYNITKVLYILFGLSGVFFIVWIWILGDKALEEDPSLAGSVMNPWISITIGGLIFTSLLALVGPVINMVSNPKNAVKMLIALGGLVIIGFICYSFATNNFDIVELETLETTAEVSRSVGAALIFTYIVGGLAVISIIFSGIAGLFKS